jgi:perosamine synthetase
MIGLFRPSLGDEEAAAVRDALASGWIGLGPRTAAFEERFARHVGAPFAIAVNSGTAALHLAMLALRLPADAEVVVPAMTFVSTAHAVVLAGARIVFADVDPETLNLDPADVERRLSPRTRAIVPVHYGGQPCAMDALAELAASCAATLVEDAAHAAGARYRNRTVGSLSLLTCFSFHGVKNMTTGDGGCITTASAEHASHLRRLRWLGIDRDTWQRVRGTSGGSEYEVTDLGLKYQMNDIAAAIGLVQLAKLERMNARRRLLAARYDAALGDLGWLSVPVVRPDVTSARHNYAVQLDRRDELRAWLAERGIAAGVHYMPLHLHPFYRPVRGSLPAAERAWRRLLLLPLYPDLTDDEQEQVIRAVRAFG